jgi:hypothetical protein
MARRHPQAHARGRERRGQLVKRSKRRRKKEPGSVVAGEFWITTFSVVCTEVVYEVNYYASPSLSVCV